MYLRTILIILTLGALALLAVVNWNAFMTPTALSLIFAEVEAPLGLVLVGAIVFLSGLFLTYVVYLQSSVLFEARRHARDLSAQRELAEQAESSRIHELRQFVESRLEILGEQTEQAKVDLIARLDRQERETTLAVKQCEKTLAAYISGLDDRQERDAGLPARTHA